MPRFSAQYFSKFIENKSLQNNTITRQISKYCFTSEEIVALQDVVHVYQVKLLQIRHWIEERFDLQDMLCRTLPSHHNRFLGTIHLQLDLAVNFVEVADYKFLGDEIFEWCSIELLHSISFIISDNFLIERECTGMHDWFELILEVFLAVECEIVALLI